MLKNLYDPFYPLFKEFQDVVCRDPPSVLPPDVGVRHEIDLVPGIKCCITLQLPLPIEQCDAIDDFFRAKHEAAMVREDKSPHSTPKFCVKSRTASGVLCMLIPSLMRLLFRNRPIYRKNIL